jgi:hypothetical protein
MTLSAMTMKRFMVGMEVGGEPAELAGLIV